VRLPHEWGLGINQDKTFLHKYGRTTFKSKRGKGDVLNTHHILTRYFMMSSDSYMATPVFGTLDPPEMDAHLI
jgi:hypothetical protein